MADDKKNIPEAAPPAEAPAPAIGNAVVPEQPAPEPELTDAEKVMLEHEGQPLPRLPLLAGHWLCDLLPGAAGRHKGQGVTVWPVS